jgi:hypothetical protein
MMLRIFAHPTNAALARLSRRLLVFRSGARPDAPRCAPHQALATRLAFFGEMPTFADFVGPAIITIVCVWVSTAARDNRVREAS